MPRSLAVITLIALLPLAATAQGPARHDILRQCPQLTEQLPERLAAAKNEIEVDALVRVQLVVGRDGLQRIESIEGPPRYRSRVRIALQGLDCRPAEAQRHVLNLQFGDATPSLGFAAR